MNRFTPEPEPERLHLDFRPLRVRRQLLDISQVRLAHRIGAYRNSVHYWENGTRMPSALDLIRMARVLGTPTFELFDVIEEKPTRARICRR